MRPSTERGRSGGAVEQHPRFPLGTWVYMEWFADRTQRNSEIYMNGALVPKASGRIREGPAIPVPWNQVARSVAPAFDPDRERDERARGLGRRPRWSP